MKKIAALLAHGGQIGAGDAESVSAWRRAKAAVKFLAGHQAGGVSN